MPSDPTAYPISSCPAPAMALAAAATSNSSSTPDVLVAVSPCWDRRRARRVEEMEARSTHCPSRRVSPMPLAHSVHMAGAEHCTQRPASGHCTHTPNALSAYWPTGHKVVLHGPADTPSAITWTERAQLVHALASAGAVHALQLAWHAAQAPVALSANDAGHVATQRPRSQWGVLPAVLHVRQLCALGPSQVSHVASHALHVPLEVRYWLLAQLDAHCVPTSTGLTHGGGLQLRQAFGVAYEHTLQS